MLTKKISKVAGLLLVAAVLISGCSAGGGDKPAVEQVLRIGQTSEFKDVYNSLWQDNGALWQVLVFRTLFTPASNLTDVEPDLATSYSVSDDGLTVTIEVTDDAVWDDGEPVTADDVVWSLTTALKAAQVNKNYVAAFSRIEGAEAVLSGDASELSGVTTDGSSVTIQLTQPVSSMLPLLGQFAIYPEHLLKDADVLQLQNDPFWLHPVGNGMFKVEKFEPNQYVTLVPSETWTGEAPTIRRIEVTVTTDPVSDFEAGKIDYFFTNDVGFVDGLSTVKSAIQHPVDALFFRYFLVNAAGNAPFDNPRVREAMMYAIDRETIVRTLYRNAATIFNTGVPSGYEGSWSGQQDYAYDPDKARQILEEEGFDFSRTLRLRYYYADQISIDFMTAVAQSLTDIGLKVDSQKFQGDATTELAVNRDYDLAYKGLSVFSEEEWYNEYFDTRGQAIYGEQSEFRELMDKYSRSIDPAEREQVLTDLQKLDQKELLKLPLFLINVYIYTSDRLQGVPEDLGNPWWRFKLDFANWSISE